jgi:broad specificity phosphatase PhoE
MSQTVWIARHGNRLDFVYPEWFNTAERRYDPPLSEDGVFQARELAQRLKQEKIRHIFASPFLRTIQTANAVAEILDLSIKLEAGLSEWLNPNWMSQTPEIHPQEILAPEYPRIDWTYQSLQKAIYPENKVMVRQRTRATIEMLLLKYTEDILVVGHSESIFGVAAGLIGGSPSIATPLCGLTKIVCDRDRARIVLNGDTSHLSHTETLSIKIKRQVKSFAYQTWNNLHKKQRR